MPSHNANLSVRIITFNAGREFINVDHFAKSVFFPDQERELPDLLVLCIEEIAPIAQSFLGSSFLTPYTKRFVKAVQQSTKHAVDYEVVIAPNVGLTSLILFARPDVRARTQWLATAGVGVGYWAMGNKGAVGVKIGLSTHSEAQVTELTFVAAHLAAGETKVERRNHDWKAVVSSLVFQRHNRGTKPMALFKGEEQPLLSRGHNESSKAPSRLFKDSSPIFLAGDLNYRTSAAGPQPVDVQNFPQPSSDHSDPQHWCHLRVRDQLDREREAGRTMHNLDEVPINFPPTYKYDNSRQRLNKPDGSEPDYYQWAPHRWPGWCDRILYSAFLTGESMMKVGDYVALPLQPTSDHRPVALSFTLDLAAVDKSAAVVSAPFEMNKYWKSERAAARRREIVVGVFAYISLTWEGRALLAATIVGMLGGWLVIRTLVGT